MSGIAIEEVELPSGLTEIGKNVFCDNPNLAGINLGNLVIMGRQLFPQSAGAEGNCLAGDPYTLWLWVFQ